MWRAASIDEAIDRAETEATEYSAGGDGHCVGLAQAFHLFVDAEVGDGTEVFSLMRDSTVETAATEAIARWARDASVTEPEEPLAAAAKDHTARNRRLMVRAVLVASLISSQFVPS